jgi:hypothetical protein
MGNCRRASKSGRKGTRPVIAISRERERENEREREREREQERGIVRERYSKREGIKR